MRAGVLFLIGLLMAGCTADAAGPGGRAFERAPAIEVPATRDTLAAVRDRGHLRCGTDEGGFWSHRGLGGGFADDLCAVVAAAVLGDAAAVERVVVGDGVAALAAGDADVVVGGLAWTASRDGVGQVAFTTPMFFDGAGVMVRADGIGDLAGLADTIACVAEGRFTVGAARRLDALGARPVSFPDAARVEAAFRARACDAWVDDVSRLVEARTDYSGDPDELVILSEQLTLRPLAPAVADGDAVWRNAVAWAVLVTLVAEEAGLGAQGVADREHSGDPTVRRLMGLRTVEAREDRPVRFNPGLGLPADFAARVVGQVGNYAEIHARHFGRLGLPRGPTGLVDEGGLLSPPPFH